MAGQQIPVTAHVQPEDKVIRPRETVAAVPQVDVTVILYSSGESPVLLATQLRAIRSQTVQPMFLDVHVDGPAGHDERTLSKLNTCRTSRAIGRQHRLALARGAATNYVAILEEDAMPGPMWLERAMEAMGEADTPELQYGPAVIACSGVLQGSENPSDAHVVGAELPRGDQSLEVDFGRQGWLFATEFARVVEGLPYEGVSSDSLGILLAAAAQQAGVPTVVLDYGVDHANWGSTTPHQYGLDPEDAHDAFLAYLELGWEPPCTGKSLSPTQSAQQTPGAPTLPATAAPGDVVEKHYGGTTTREFVLPPDQRTPDPNQGRERVLTGSEATPPPPSAATEEVVEPTPPPDSAYTETIQTPSTPPASETGQ
jgi:hypothetical protein